MASIISCTVSGVKALCTSGRLMLMRAMPSYWWKRISLYFLISFQGYLLFITSFCMLSESIYRLACCCRGCFNFHNPCSTLCIEEVLKRVVQLPLVVKRNVFESELLA